MAVRNQLKSATEIVLARGGPAQIVRRLSRTRGVCFAFHNVVPDRIDFRGERSLHLPLSRFVGFLDHLTEHYRIVPVDELAGGVGDDSVRPRAALTFDDAYRGGVCIGLPEVVRRELPATVFVSPSFVGGSAFWWDVLGEQLGGSIPRHMREHALDELHGDDELVRRWIGAGPAQARRIPDVARCASERELKDAAGLPGVSLGGHGWSHRNLTRLAPSALEAELKEPLEWLRRRFLCTVPWLSYPYGLSTERVRRAAARAGYRGGLTLEGGGIGAGPASLLTMPRINVPAGLTSEGFALRAAGLIRG